MIGKLACVALSGVVAITLVACMPEQAAVEGPTYQAPAVAVGTPPNLANICYSDGDLGIVHARMTQQVFATGVLGCKTADGQRRYQQHYANFVGKFKADLTANAGALQDLVNRKRLNMDVVVTEMANRTAGRANDSDFCSRLERGLNWSLSPKVTVLRQVPPPYDFSSEMRMFPCPTGRG